MQNFDIMHDKKFSNKTSVARISNDFFSPNTCISFKVSVRGIRLFLYILYRIQNTKHTPAGKSVKFLEDKEVMMAALGVENSNRRYKLLEETFEEIKKGIVLRQTNGSDFRWDHIAIVERITIDSTNQDITMLITNSAITLLNELKKYTCLSPQYYLPLTSSVQLWFYVFFKCNLPNKKVRISINDLLQLLDLSQSYVTQRAITVFFNKIIGIKAPLNKSKKTWEFTTDKNGNNTGALAMICEKTDVFVTATPIKKSRSYTHIEFTIKEDKDRTSRSRKASLEAKEKAVKEKARINQQKRRLAEKAEQSKVDTQQPIAPKEEDPKAKMMDITNRLIDKFKC